MPSPGQRANLSLWWACRPANPMTPQAAPLAEVTLPRGRTWVRSVGAAHGPGGGQPGPGCGTAVRGAECGDPPVGGAPAVIGGHQPQDPALAPGPAATSRRPARPGHRRTRRVEIVAHHFPFTYRAARHATGRPGWCRTGGTSSGAGARCHPRRRKPEANNPYAPPCTRRACPAVRYRPEPSGAGNSPRGARAGASQPRRMSQQVRPVSRPGGPEVSSRY